MTNRPPLAGPTARCRRVPVLLCLALWGAPALALELPGGAQQTAERISPGATLSLPVGPWNAEGIETAARDGTVTRRAFRIPQSSLTTLQIAAPLRRTLEADGYDVLYDCAAKACGGFDFRYALDLLPEPDMHVDLGDFRYLAARSNDGKHLIGIVASRGASDGYIHISESETGATGAPVLTAPETADAETDAEIQTPGPAPVIASRNGTPLLSELQTDGRAVLDDLAFATGSSALEARSFPSLIELAAWLNSDPESRVVLVGHSDAVGDLDTNVALSRARARAVVQRLIEAHNVPSGQLRAEGIGYLAPLASNATERGRAVNRRVEVILADGG